MPETTSAQPLTLFQSPVMAALERLLSQLTRRVAGPQSQFGSRNLSFVERILSRRLDSLGFAPTGDQPTPERAVPPQSWLLPRTWVPSPAELLRSEQPAAPAGLPAGAPAAAPLSVTSPQRRPVVVPLPSPTAARGAPASPAMPLPIPDELPAAAPQTAVAARPAAGRPVETQAPAVAKTPTPAASSPLSALASPASPPSSPAVEPLAAAPTLPAAEPRTEAPSAAAPAAPSAPSAPPAATLESVAAAPLATAASVESAPPVAAPETRVRDWLAQWSSSPAPTAAPTAAPAQASASPTLPSASLAASSSGPSAFARSFNHLGWADTQLTRSPSQRLAAAPASMPPLGEPAARPSPMLAMPMVATPELAPPTKQPLSVAPAGATPRPAPPEAAARRVAAPASPRPVAAAVSAPPALAALPQPFVAPAQQAAEAQARAVAGSPQPAALPAQLSALSAPPAAAATGRSLTQSVTLDSVQGSGLELGLLARPLLPGLSSVQAGLGAPLAPAQPGAWLPPAWSEPGALASRFDSFAASHRSAGAAAAPQAGPSGMREWAAAPGVPAALSRALHREDSYTPARWQRPEAALPYLPAPMAEPAPQAAQQGPAASLAARPAPLSAASRASLRAPSLSMASPLAAPGQAAPPLPQPGAGEPAQPWRAIGGAATLAELFAAGIGLGSGSIATLAQTAGAGAGGLIADWLQPLLRAGAGEERAAAPAAAPLGEKLLNFLAPDAPAAAAAAPAASPLSVQAPGRRPIGAASEPPLSALGRGLAEPAPQGRWLPTASGLVWVAPEQAAPTAARAAGQEGRAASPQAAAAAPKVGAGWSQMGALGLRTEQLAATQSVRVAGASLASPTERREWVGAPGISDVIARALGREESQAPARWQQLGSPLPFVSPPSVEPSPASESERAATRPTAAPRPQPSAAPAATQRRRPWLELGGTAALAEIFAAGVGLGSGSAGQLAEASPQRKPGLVASWLQSMLSAPEASTAGPRGAAEPGSQITASMLPYLGPDVAPRRERVAPAQQPGGERSAERVTPLSPTRAWPRAGGLSVGAEQFAASHGLGGVAGAATPSEAGQWVPIAGGMVFVPREERPEQTPTATPKATLAERPQAPPLPSLSALPLAGEAWSRAGGMGLRTELFASQQVASKQPGAMVGQLALPEQGRALGTSPEAESSPRWGWSGAGGLIFLGSGLGPASGPGAASAEAGREPGMLRPSSFDLATLGFSAPQPRAELGAQRQPLSLSWAAPSVADAGQAGEASESEQASESEPAGSRRAWSGGLPMLSLPPESPRSAGQPPVATGAAAQATQQLGARFAAPMLTSFPRQASAEQAPPSLWPQNTLATTERLTRVLSMLPTGWQPTPAVASAMAEAGAPGMPLWQRIPMPTPAVAPAAAAASSRELTSIDPTDDDDAEEPLQSRSDMPMVSVRPGGAPRQRQQQQQQRPAVAPAPSQPPARRAPDTQMITAALEASGASKAQVEASVKLMQAIRSHATSGVAKSDDRLSLDDLHMIAISMGQGKMAASQSPISSAVGSVDAALRLPPALHPNTPEDTPTVNKKVKHLSDMVIKLINTAMNQNKIRSGRG